MKFLKHAVAALCILTSVNAAAGPINFTHSTSEGEIYNIEQLSAYTTGGDDMNGVLVTVNYLDGTSDTAEFDAGSIGDNYGAASGNGWSLSFNGGSTFSSNWLFDFASGASAVTSLIIDGIAGGVLFDYLYSFDVSTPDSARGGPGSNNGPSNVSSSQNLNSMSFEYSDQVALNDVIYGDLFATLRINFDSALTAGNDVQFRTDTDNLIGNFTKVNDIPEPSTTLLFALSLIAVGLRKRFN